MVCTNQSGGAAALPARLPHWASTLTHHPPAHPPSLVQYPIMGAMRHTWGGPWEVLRRVQKGPGEEEYVCIGSWDKEPTPPQITEAFRAAWAAQQAAQQSG